MWLKGVKTTRRWNPVSPEPALKRLRHRRGWHRLAKYVGKYIARQIGQRLPEDKGARLGRYSRHTNKAGTNFGWASPGAAMWRRKLRTFCRMLGLNAGNSREFLKEWLSKN